MELAIVVVRFLFQVISHKGAESGASSSKLDENSGLVFLQVEESILSHPVDYLALLIGVLGFRVQLDIGRGKAIDYFLYVEDLR